MLGPVHRRGLNGSLLLRPVASNRERRGPAHPDRPPPIAQGTCDAECWERSDDEPDRAPRLPRERLRSERPATKPIIHPRPAAGSPPFAWEIGSPPHLSLRARRRAKVPSRKTSRLLRSFLNGCVPMLCLGSGFVQILRVLPASACETPFTLCATGKLRQNSPIDFLARVTARGTAPVFSESRVFRE